MLVQTKSKPIFHQRRLLRFSFVLMFIMFILIPALPSRAQEIRAFSLKEAQDYAVHNSYDARKSQMDVLAAQKKLRETVSGGLPQVSSSIGYINNLELNTVLIPDFFGGDLTKKIPVQFGTQHNANFDLKVDQLIFNGSYLVGLSTSKIYTRLADQGLERTQLDVCETITNTYYLILVSEESEKIIQGNLANLEKTLYEIQELHKEGFVEATDVDLIQISVTGLKNSLQSLQKQTETAYKLLKFQMGLDLDEKIQLSENLEEIIQNVNPEKLLAEQVDLENSIDFQLVNTQEKLAEMNLRNENSKYFPSISAFYSLQYNAQRNSFNLFNFKVDWFRSQMIGVTINIPIFKSGAQRARVQQASITLDQARNTARQASEGLLLEDSQVRNALSAAYESYLNVKDNMEVAKRVYDATLIKYKEGLSSSMDLTQANDRYLQSQSNYIQAISKLLSAKNRLNRIRNHYESQQ